VEAGADALGFVFAPSPRRVSPREAGRIAAALPPAVEKIGVFVNQSLKLVLDTVETAGLTGVQLHGEEDARFAARLRKGGRALRVIKVISLRAAGEGSALAAFRPHHESSFSALLLDSGGNGRRGGTGAAFDWREAAPLASLLGRKFSLIIAGGLNPDNVAKAIAIFRPWGVDVVSGVEQSPGKKDPEKLRAFVGAVRRWGAPENAHNPQASFTSE
jgi:phosphoribosylanthranilate isomerase